MRGMRCYYCGEEIENHEPVFIVYGKYCFHQYCFLEEYSVEYYKRAEDAKADIVATMKGAERV